jgi:hypothetical protein
MDSLEQSFHGSFKPRWGPDGSCIIASQIEPGGSALDRVNVFSQNGLAAEVGESPASCSETDI